MLFFYFTCKSKVSAKVSQRNSSGLEPYKGLDHYSERSPFAVCRLHMITKFIVCIVLFSSGDLQLLGIDFSFKPYLSILTSSLKLESKQAALDSTSSFGSLLIFQHLLINKIQPGWSPLALFCCATSLVLSLSRKELFPAVFLKLQECRGMPHLLPSVCRKPPETDK